MEIFFSHPSSLFPFSPASSFCQGGQVGKFTKGERQRFWAEPPSLARCLWPGIPSILGGLSSTYIVAPSRLEYEELLGCGSPGRKEDD